MMAIYRRDADRRDGEPGAGQVVDLSLFEPLFRLCIPHLTIYDRSGEIRERIGNDFPDAAPRSLYRTADDRWLGAFCHIAKHVGGPGSGDGSGCAAAGPEVRQQRRQTGK